MGSPIGEALGNAIAGYRDRDNKRCATGLADVVAETTALREVRDNLLQAVSLAIHELNYCHPERALEVLKSARAALLAAEESREPSPTQELTK